MLPLLVATLLSSRASGMVPEEEMTNAFVAAGKHFSFVVDNGRIRGAGRNDRGQLGTGDTVDNATLTHVDIDGDPIIVDAATGGFHTLFLSDQGSASLGPAWALGRSSIHGKASS